MSTEKNYAILQGFLDPWPSKDELAKILKSGGLNLHIGKYSIRVLDCSHFSFEALYGSPHIEADADSLMEMVADAKLVSGALANARIKHSFEVYEMDSSTVGAYLHYNDPYDSNS